MLKGNFGGMLEVSAPSGADQHSIRVGELAHYTHESDSGEASASWNVARVTRITKSVYGCQVELLDIHDRKLQMPLTQVRPCVVLTSVPVPATAETTS